eukprot:gene7799-9599_t
MISRAIINNSKTSKTILNTIQKHYKDSRSIYTLPDIQYTKTGIKGFLSAKAIKSHLDHHKNDIERANQLVSRTPWEFTTINKAIKQSHSNRDDSHFFDAVSSHFNHSFFWNNITDLKKTPSIFMLKAFDLDFGSFTTFKQQFSTMATALHSPGFVWLVFHSNRLKVITTFGNGSPLEVTNCFPLLCLDLHEHAYYPDYNSDKNKYISNFWNCIDWSFVEKKLLNALIIDKDYKIKVQNAAIEQASRQGIWMDKRTQSLAANLEYAKHIQESNKTPETEEIDDGYLPIDHNDMDLGLDEMDEEFAYESSIEEENIKDLARQKDVDEDEDEGIEPDFLTQDEKKRKY